MLQSMGSQSQIWLTDWKTTTSKCFYLCGSYTPFTLSSSGQLSKKGCTLLCSHSLVRFPSAAAAKSLQSCPTLCDPMMAAHQDPLSLGFCRQEHWSGLPFPSPMHESKKWKWSHSFRVWPSATPWTAAYQAPPSMGFSRQEYWRGVPLPSPSDFLSPYKQVSFSCLILITYSTA